MEIQQNLAQIRNEYANIGKDFETKQSRLLKDLHQFEGRIAAIHDLLQNTTIPEAEGGSPYGATRLEGDQLIVHTPSPDGGEQPANRLQEVTGG